MSSTPPNPPAGPAAADLHAFRLAEYNSLTELVNARDERVDRFITVYLTLQGAPFALYAVLIKQVALPSDPVPPLVAWALLFCGAFGIYLVQVIVQLRFSTLLYIRAMNGIRSYYGGTAPHTEGLWLPANTKQPAYHEGRHVVGGKVAPAKYMFHIIQAMSLLNAIYVGLGLFFAPRLIDFPEFFRFAIPAVCMVWIAWMQIESYRKSAEHRETRATGTGLI